MARSLSCATTGRTTRTTRRGSSRPTWACRWRASPLGCARNVAGRTGHAGHDGGDFARSSLHRNSRPGGRCPKRRAALRIMPLHRSACLVGRRWRRPSRASPNAGQDTRILHEVELRPGAAYQPYAVARRKRSASLSPRADGCFNEAPLSAQSATRAWASVSSAGSIRLETSTRSTSSELSGGWQGSSPCPVPQGDHVSSEWRARGTHHASSSRAQRRSAGSVWITAQRPKIHPHIMSPKNRPQEIDCPRVVALSPARGESPRRPGCVWPRFARRRGPCTRRGPRPGGPVSRRPSRAAIQLVVLEADVLVV